MGFVRWVHAALLAAGVAVVPCAADPPKGGVRVPAGPVVPQPMPPNPHAPIRLTADLVLAVDADSECVVIASPADRLRVTADKGPLRVRGKFVDGNGSVETRTFAGSHVYFVEAAAEGECELLVLPVGGKESDLIRRRILCVVGPQPPPVPPDPKPPVPPDPKPPEPVKSFRVIFVVESGATPKPGQVAVSDAAAVRDWLKANCTPEGGLPGYRVYDPDQNTTGEQPVMKALWAAVKPKLTALPCWVVEVNGKADILPYPASAAEALATLKKYKGG